MPKHSIERNLVFQGGSSSQHGLDVRAQEECHRRAHGKHERKDGIEHRLMQPGMIAFRHDGPKVGERRYSEEVGEIGWDRSVPDRRLRQCQQAPVAFEIFLDRFVKGFVQDGHAVPATEGDKEDRLEKRSIVVVADALVHEKAMMVVHEDATVTNLAVVTAWWPDMVANLAATGSGTGVDEHFVAAMARVGFLFLLRPLKISKPRRQRSFRRGIVSALELF
jgi:hypothetical protein